MSDLPFTPADPGLAARLDACLDIEDKIPRALDRLGPVADRDVLLVDPADGRWAGRLAALGARVTGLSDPASAGRFPAVDDSADALVSLWSSFRAPSPAELQDADRILRPGGRLLVVQDYGRDDVSGLRGDLPEYGDWSRRDGWYLSNGFRIRVIHCFWTFDSIDEARSFLADAFGAPGAVVGEALRRPRLSYNVAVYHRSRPGLEPAA